MKAIKFNYRSAKQELLESGLSENDSVKYLGHIPTRKIEEFSSYVNAALVLRKKDSGFTLEGLKGFVDAYRAQFDSRFFSGKHPTPRDVADFYNSVDKFDKFKDITTRFEDGICEQDDPHAELLLRNSRVAA